jgi:hypothetical protein
MLLAGSVGGGISLVGVVLPCCIASESGDLEKALLIGNQDLPMFVHRFTFAALQQCEQVRLSWSSPPAGTGNQAVPSRRTCISWIKFEAARLLARDVCDLVSTDGVGDSRRSFLTAAWQVLSPVLHIESVATFAHVHSLACVFPCLSYTPAFDS